MAGSDLDTARRFYETNSGEQEQEGVRYPDGNTMAIAQFSS